MALCLSVCLSVCRSVYYYAPRPRLSVPWRSCLGYRLATAGHQRCVDCGPVRERTLICRDFWMHDWRRNDMSPSNCRRRGHIVSPPPGRYLVYARCVFGADRGLPDTDAVRQRQAAADLHRSASSRATERISRRVYQTRRTVIAG